MPNGFSGILGRIVLQTVELPLIQELESAPCLNLVATQSVNMEPTLRKLIVIG